MKCTDAQRKLLEADLFLVRGEGDDPLALHVRSCPRCREIATTILEAEAGLARSLSGALPPMDLDLILERAGLLEAGIPEARIDEARDAEAGIAEVTDVRSLNLRRPGWSRIRPGVALIPLAAAAVLTALFLGRPPNLPGPDYTPTAEAPGLNVEVPQGRSVAVLETNNPEITVLWLF